MLEVKNISVFYGKVQALHSVSITVDNEEIVAIIGSNGAGKTTLMKTIMGICRPSEGQISYDGKELQKLPPHKVVEKGIIYVPEGRKIFPRLSVRENLEMGAFSQRIRRRDTMRNRIEEVCTIFPKLSRTMQKQTDFLLCAIWLVMELEEIFTRNHRCQTLSRLDEV